VLSGQFDRPSCLCLVGRLPAFPFHTSLVPCARPRERERTSGHSNGKGIRLAGSAKQRTIEGASSTNVQGTEQACLCPSLPPVLPLPCPSSRLLWREFGAVRGRRTSGQCGGKGEAFPCASCLRSVPLRRSAVSSLLLNAPALCRGLQLPPSRAHGHGRTRGGVSRGDSFAHAN
jgi:hypothetical protein